MNNSLSFSGHESFPCKYFWLKKGYDFVKKQHSFTQPEAVVQLGVGKNMVAAIRFWLKAFGLTDDKDGLKNIAKLLFEDNGDPYLEDIGTVWLLHYLLVTTERSSIYSLLFNEFRKNYVEFSRDDLAKFIQQKCDETKSIYNENTVRTDIGVFIKNYHRPTNKIAEKIEKIEDDFSTVLLDLNLLKTVERADKKEVFYFNSDRRVIPLPILLYAILQQLNGNPSINFNQLLNNSNQIGNVFMLNAEQLYEYLKALAREYPFILLSDNAGVRTLQFKETINSSDLLNQYYATTV